MTTVKADSSAKRQRIIIKLLVMVMLFVLIGVGVTAYFLIGRSVWTDERTIHVVNGQEYLREVLWTQPRGEDEINTDNQEYEPALSPDGTELYFVLGKPSSGAVAKPGASSGADIYVSLRRNNAWSKPQPIAAINTGANELGPRLSPDGSILLFYSDREGGLGQYDIWASKRTIDGWGEPFNLGPNVNSPYNEYGAAFTPDWKRFYFASNRKEAAKLDPGADAWRATIREAQVNLGNYDLYSADLVLPAVVDPNAPSPDVALSPRSAPAPESLEFQAAVEVEGINTEYHEGAPCISPVGDFLYFSSNRPGGEGGFDLYRVRLSQGRWVDLENLGPQINTPANEADPQLSMRGFQLYFSSDRRPALAATPEAQDVAPQQNVAKSAESPADQAATAGDDTQTVARPDYNIYLSESREVFVKREGRPMPQLAWSWWLLLAALLLLIPLLLFYRDIDSDKLSLLQRCLLISVIAHLIITLLFSFVVVVAEQMEIIKKEAPMEVAVNLEITREYEMRTDVREQVTELPTQQPTLTQTPRMAQTFAPAPPPQFTPLNLPPAQARPSAIALAAEAPRPVNPTPVEQVEVAPPPLHAALPQLDVQPPIERVAEAEAKVQPETAQPQDVQRQQTPDRTADATPTQVNLQTTKAEPMKESLAQATSQENPVAQPEAFKPVNQPKVDTSVDVTTPQQPAQQVRTNQTDKPQVAAAQTTTERVATQAASAPASSVKVNVPKAATASESLAEAAQSEQARTAPAPQPTQANLPTLTQSAQVTAPQSTAQPIRSDAAEAPKVAEAIANASRVATAAATANAEAVEVTVPKAQSASASLAAAAATQEPRTADAPRAESVELPQIAQAPRVTAPDATAQPIRSDSKEAPSVTEAATAAARVQTQAVKGSVAQVEVNVPTTDAVVESLASAAVTQPNAAPEPTTAPKSVELPKLVNTPSINTPDAAAQPIRTTQVEAPQVAESSSNVTRVDSTGTPSTASAAPVKVAVPTAKADSESLASAAQSTPRATPTDASAPVKVDLPTLTQAPQVTPPDVTGSPIKAAAASAPKATEAATASARVETSTAAASAQLSQVKLDAPATDAAKSSASLAQAVAAASRVANADLLPPLQLDLPPVTAEVELDAPKSNGAPVKAADAAAAPTSSESQATTVRANTDQASPSQAAPSSVEVGVPNSELSKSSLASAAAAQSRLAETLSPLAIELPSFEPNVEIDAPKSDDAPVKTASKAAPAVAESSPTSTRVTTTASPNSRPSDVKVAAPSTRSTTESIAVAVSTNIKPAAAPQPLISIDIPVAEPSARVQLPTQASLKQEAEAKPLASAVEAPRPVEQQELSVKVKNDTPSELLRPSLDNEHVTTQFVSLIKRAADDELRTRKVDATYDPDTPRPVVDLTLGSLGPGAMTAPEAFFKRKVEERNKMIDELGGSEKTEDAVARALRWLANNQEPDGRWTHITNGGKPGKRGRSEQDTALTGLAVLCFLGADHTPTKPGPYQQTVAAGVDFIIRYQKPNGDLRKGGDMYTQGIATIAVAEAALMTKDQRYRDSAFLAAKFIIDAQHKSTGGWRYQPGDPGDTSVFGWQVMALHACEQLGYDVPPETYRLAERWLKHVTENKSLRAGYQGPSPNPAMTAEAIFSRMLLGEVFEDNRIDDACDYLLRESPGRGRPNYYGWYYASLMMRQLENESWTKWNEAMSDYLLKQQVKSGDNDGSWGFSSEWGERGGRVYSTAMCTLMLEVYYRYTGLYRGKSAFDPKEVAAVPRKPK